MNLETAIDQLKNNDPSFTTLSLKEGQITDKVADSFIEALKQNRTVITLELKNNQITDKIADALFKALKENHTLTTLSLEKNQITDKGTDSFFGLRKVNQTLTSLNLKSNLVSSEIPQKIQASLSSIGKKSKANNLVASPIITKFSKQSLEELRQDSDSRVEKFSQRIELYLGRNFRNIETQEIEEESDLMRNFLSDGSQTLLITGKAGSGKTTWAVVMEEEVWEIEEEFWEGKPRYLPCYLDGASAQSSLEDLALQFLDGWSGLKDLSEPNKQLPMLFFIDSAETLSEEAHQELKKMIEGWAASKFIIICRAEMTEYFGDLKNNSRNMMDFSEKEMLELVSDEKDRKIVNASTNHNNLKEATYSLAFFSALTQAIHNQPLHKQTPPRVCGRFIQKLIDYDMERIQRMQGDDLCPSREELIELYKSIAYTMFSEGDKEKGVTLKSIDSRLATQKKLGLLGYERKNICFLIPMIYDYFLASFLASEAMRKSDSRHPPSIDPKYSVSDFTSTLFYSLVTA